jgi:hypothetical protein
MSSKEAQRLWRVTCGVEGGTWTTPLSAASMHEKHKNDVIGTVRGRRLGWGSLVSAAARRGDKTASKFNLGIVWRECYF